LLVRALVKQRCGVSGELLVCLWSKNEEPEAGEQELEEKEGRNLRNGGLATSMNFEFNFEF
jgi:hypothetical protein